MTTDADPRMVEFERLLGKVSDTSFDCGEHDGEVGYGDVFDAAIAADDALREWVRAQLAPEPEPETIFAPDGYGLTVLGHLEAGNWSRRKAAETLVDLLRGRRPDVPPLDPVPVPASPIWLREATISQLRDLAQIPTVGPLCTVRLTPPEARMILQRLPPDGAR